MKLRTRRISRLAWVAAGLLACQERLAAPANCPADCPGGEFVKDTILSPIVGGDSSFLGYVESGQSLSLRISNGLPASDDRAIIRFVARSDTFPLPTGQYHHYTVDSVAFIITLVQRDTLVDRLKILFYRLPATIDTATTFAQVQGSMVPANLLDSAVVNDTTKTGTVRIVVPGSGLVVPPEDSGRVAIGLAIHADSATGIRIATIIADSTPAMNTYVRADSVVDTLVAKQTLSHSPAFERSLQAVTPAFDPDLLTVGGIPSARSLLRFALPRFIRDSASLVRVTLELTPLAPMLGLRGDTARLEVHAVLADLGAKSPLNTTAFASIGLPNASADTVRFELVRLLAAWKADTTIPQAIVLQLQPEAGSFTRAVFGSTRSGTGKPQLRVTYALPFPFEKP